MKAAQKCKTGLVCAWGRHFLWHCLALNMAYTWLAYDPTVSWSIFSTSSGPKLPRCCISMGQTPVRLRIRCEPHERLGVVMSDDLSPCNRRSTTTTNSSVGIFSVPNMKLLCQSVPDFWQYFGDKSPYIGLMHDMYLE